MLQTNIQLLRDAIVLFTARSTAQGVSGHTSMFKNTNICIISWLLHHRCSYDTVPEVWILLAHFWRFRQVPSNRLWQRQQVRFLCAKEWINSCRSPCCYSIHPRHSQRLAPRRTPSPLPRSQLQAPPGVKFSLGNLGTCGKFMHHSSNINSHSKTGQWSMASPSLTMIRPSSVLALMRSQQGGNDMKLRPIQFNVTFMDPIKVCRPAFVEPFFDAYFSPQVGFTLCSCFCISS